MTIHGAGFNVLDDGAHVSCEFGRGEVYNAKFTVVRPVERVTHSTIVCEAPTTRCPTRANWIALNGYEIDGGRDPVPTNQNYTYYNPPTVDSVLPQAGVFSGGTVVTLLGQGFYGLAGNPELASCRRGDVARRRARGAGRVSDRAALQLLDVPIAVAVEHPRGRGGVRADHIEHAAVRRHR